LVHAPATAIGISIPHKWLSHVVADHQEEVCLGILGYGISEAARIKRPRPAPCPPKLFYFRLFVSETFKSHDIVPGLKQWLNQNARKFVAEQRVEVSTFLGIEKEALGHRPWRCHLLRKLSGMICAWVLYSGYFLGQLL